MKIICHRGYWSKKNQQNTIESFQHAFEHGFGIETDIRDSSKKIKISHDPTTNKAIELEKMFQQYRKRNIDLTLALNVKADGLQDAVADLIRKYTINKYFFFDMSLPDMIGYHKKGLKFFTRISDIEPEALFLKEAAGVWVDHFYSEWITEADVDLYLEQGKQVCIVSPELHKRDYRSFWDKISKWHILKDEKLMLCTDLPEHAQSTFSSSI
jgi:hypothetical protein